MTYSLQFIAPTEKEWRKLGATIREPFKTKLSERLETPRVAADALHGLPDHDKIKLRALGYRLVCRVEDRVVTVTVVAVGRRERSEVQGGGSGSWRALSRWHLLDAPPIQPRDPTPALSRGLLGHQRSRLKAGTGLSQAQP